MAEQEAIPTVTFSTFVISLASSAMVHLGETSDPLTGERGADLGLARHTIDALGVLEEKTRGNLDDEEQKLIDSLLLQLRSKFVERSRALRGVAAPAEG